jgi:O-acetyl-ADP-ribose deacetylase (regulator of RNase III)
VPADLKPGRSPADRIEVVSGDITTLAVDAIVNAANPSLAGGGGVAGAIHEAAGPGLLEECHKLGGCATGSAKVTGGHDLPARWVIHAVGPVWRGGDRDEEALLASCYRTSLELAVAHGARSVAFPAISCGVYGFPVERAAEIAIGEVAAFLRTDRQLERVLMVAFGPAIGAALDGALDGTLARVLASGRGE